MKRKDMGVQASPGPTWDEMDQRLQAALHRVAAPPTGGNSGIPTAALIPGMARSLLLMKPNNGQRHSWIGRIPKSTSPKELVEIAEHLDELLKKPSNRQRRPGTGAISESTSQKELVEIAKRSAKLLYALEAAHGPTFDALAITMAHYEDLMRNVRMLAVYAGIAKPSPQAANAEKGAPTKTDDERIAAQVRDFYVMLAGRPPTRTTNGGVSDFQILLGEVFITSGIEGSAAYRTDEVVKAVEKKAKK